MSEGTSNGKAIQKDADAIERGINADDFSERGFAKVATATGFCVRHIATLHQSVGEVRCDIAALKAATTGGFQSINDKLDTMVRTGPEGSHGRNGGGKADMTLFGMPIKVSGDVVRTIDAIRKLVVTIGIIVLLILAVKTKVSLAQVIGTPAAKPQVAKVAKHGGEQP